MSAGVATTTTTTTSGGGGGSDDSNAERREHHYHYKMPEIEPTEFRAVLEWIYTGTVKVIDPDRVPFLATAADHFNLPDLLHYTEQLLCLAVTLENAAAMLQLSETVISLSVLKQTCLAMLQSALPATSSSTACTSSDDN
jgi:hypothetical protein